MTSSTYFRLHYSTDGGNSWPELGIVNKNGDVTINDYTRLQADLSDLAGQTIWLRFYVGTSRWSTAYINLDKITIAEMPQEVLVQPIDQVGVTTMRLNWIASSLPTFSKYRIYRSTTTTVNTSSTLVVEIGDIATESFVDTGLEARKEYFYKIYVVDERDTHIPSDTVSARTLGLAIPLSTDFETNLDGWTVTGDWQLLPGVGRSGSQALVDSIGDYLPSTQTWAIFAVDLTGMDWPVLRFWDKHDFAGASWGRVEISTNGTSWGNYIYGVTGLREEWHEQSLDLSQWKNYDTVFIRFYRATDGSLGDGWLIDDLSITDNTNAPIYPVWDGFETDSGLWLKSRWSRSTSNPKEGSYCIHDSPEGRYAEDSLQRLILSHDLDLTGAVNPTLSFYVRGSLVSTSYFRVHISTDEGLIWTDLGSQNLNTGWNSLDTWVLKQQSLSAYIGQTVRIKFETSTSNQPNSDIFIDNIGIGEDAPGAPTLHDPVNLALVDVLRPTLTVNNSIDFQSDALTYQFQVFDNEELTSLVSQVPFVASGLTRTSWQVDIDLPDNGTYWWRARANDGTDDSPWSDAWVFFVNEINQAPNAISHVGPPDASTLYDSAEWLVWLTASDPDIGDQILDYSLQIDNDPLFGSPLVSLTGLTTDGIYDPDVLVGMQLSDIAGAESLTAGRWYWRVRARDERFAEGAWPASPLSFRIASDYEHWLAATYSAAEQDNPLITGEDSDTDGDGIPLMIEFGSAMDTTVASVDGAPEHKVIDVAGSLHMAIEFNRLIGTDLVFYLEVSDDLNQWTRSDATVEILHTIDSQRERCRLTDLQALDQKRFVRLGVSLPD